MIDSAPFLCPQRFRLLKSLTSSALVVLLFTGNPLSYAASMQPPLPSIKGKRLSVKIPEQIGMLQETFHGTSAKTVVLIQDAHDSLQAQENIATMIDYLVKHYGVKTVFEEGFEGPVPTDDLFGFIEDTDLRRKVSYFFLDRLRIGGAEYAHINRTQDFKLIGADNVKLHMENIDWYRKHVRHQQAVELQLQAIQSEMTKLALRHFPKELKDWLKWKDRFENDQLGIAEYTKRVIQLLLKLDQKIRVDDYPNVSFLLLAVKFKRAEHLKSVQQLHIASLLSEIQTLEDQLAEAYLTSPLQMQTFEYFMTIELLRRLNRFDVTQEEYAELKDKMPHIKTEDLAQFVSQQAQHPVVFSKKWEKMIRSAMRFYEIAELRHEEIRRQMQWFETQKNEQLAIIVYGGFHRAGIEAILKDQDFSYHVVTPTIDDRVERHQEYYRRLMSGARFNFESPMPDATAARVLTLPEKQSFFGSQIVRAEIMKILEIVERLPIDLEMELLVRAIERGLRVKQVSERSRISAYPPIQKRISQEVLRAVHKWLGALTMIAASGSGNLDALMIGEIPRDYLWDQLSREEDVTHALIALRTAYRQVLRSYPDRETFQSLDLLIEMRSKLREIYGVEPPKSGSISIRELELIQGHLQGWLQDKQIEDNLHLSRFSLDVRTKVPDEVLLSIPTPESVKRDHGHHPTWAYRYPRTGPIRVQAVYDGEEKLPVYVAYDMNPHNGEVEPHKVIIDAEAYRGFRQQMIHHHGDSSKSSGMVLLPYVANQIELRSGRPTVFMKVTDFHALTREQKNAFKKLGTWLDLRFVFYGSHQEKGGSASKELKTLQEQLGSDRVILTADSGQTVVSRYRGFGGNIHLSTGEATLLRQQVAEIFNERNDFYFFRYLGEETSLLAIALRYATSNLEGFHGQLIDITMVDQTLAHEMQAYLNNLVFASSA